MKLHNVSSRWATRLAASAVSTVAMLAIGLAGAPAAQADGILYQKRVSVGSATTTYGGYSTCISWNSSPYSGTAQCSRSWTISNTISADVGVSNGTLSASLGYNVTGSQTTSASYTTSYPKYQSGRIEARPVYYRRLVTVTGTYCHSSGVNCHTHTKTAYAYQFRGFYNYRTIRS